MVNMGGDSPKAPLSSLRHALGGSRIVHELGIATPPWPQTERAVAKKERAIDAAARKFYRACHDSSLPAPSLHSLLLFLVRQRAYLECRQHLPADYAFYKDKAYYYDTSSNPIKVAVAKAVVGVMMNMMKDMGPGNIPWPATKKAASVDGGAEA